MKTNEKYWKDIIFQASGNSLAQGIGIVGMPLLTRLYSPEAFASQAIFLQIVMLLAGFISLRYEYFVPLVKSKKESVFLIKYVVFIGLKLGGFWVIIIGVLEFIGLLGAFDKDNSNILFFSPFVAYAVSISILFQHEAQRQGAFSISAGSEVSGKVFYIFFGVIFSFFTKTTGLILTPLFGAIGKLIYLRKYIFSCFANTDKNELTNNIIKEFRSRSNGMVASNVILLITSMAPIFYIEKNFGNRVLGNYSLVMATIFLPSGLIGSAIGSVFFQRSAGMLNEGSDSEIINLWKTTIKKLIYIGLPIYAIVGIISPYAYPLIFGREWSLAGEFGRQMAVAAFASFLAGPLDKISLILGIGYYIPLINIFRLIIISSILFVSYGLQSSALNVVLYLSCGLALVYAIDLSCGRFLINKKMKKK